MSDITIRHATYLDLAEIVGLYIKMERELRHPHVTIDVNKVFVTLTNMMESGKGMVLVAQNSQSIVGFGSGQLMNYAYGYNGSVFCIEHLYMEPDYRSKGIMMLMKAECEDKLKQADIKYIEARVELDMVGAYEKMGYDVDSVKVIKSLGGPDG